MCAVVCNEKMPNCPAKRSASTTIYLKKKDQQAVKKAREQTQYYKQKCVQVQDQREDECMDCKDLEEELLKVKGGNTELMQSYMMNYLL